MQIPGETLLNELSPAATYTTQQTRETNIHIVSGIRSRDPRNQETADLSHRDRHDDDDKCTKTSQHHVAIEANNL
jgi:hypothetical protein